MGMIRWVVGLGNPGSAYEGTRHNVGFDLLDALVVSEDLSWKRHLTWSAWSATWRLPEGHKVVLVKPRTFMNRSGKVLQKAVRRGIAADQILVVYDDIDLPCGGLRLRAGGGGGGHNGVRSVADTLGTDQFPRLRVGIGPRPQGEKLVEYVLGRWTAEQQEAQKAARPRAVNAVKTAVAESVERAMNEFNRAA